MNDNTTLPPTGHDLEPWAEKAAKQRVTAFLFARRWWPTQLYSADDLTQEVLLHWLQRRHRHDPERRPAEVYFRRIADNRLRDIAEQVRAQRRGGGRREDYLSKPLADGDDDLDLGGALSAADPGPQDLAISNEAIQGLLAAASTITTRQRSVLAAELAGYSQQEIAGRLGISRQLVNQEAQAAKRGLRATNLRGYLT